METILRLFVLDPVTAYASLGASRDATLKAATELLSLATQNGYQVKSGLA
jgi:hypothetical protein